MLQNEYCLAKIGFDVPENGLSKILGRDELLAPMRRREGLEHWQAAGAEALRLQPLEEGVNVREHSCGLQRREGRIDLGCK